MMTMMNMVAMAIVVAMTIVVVMMVTAVMVADQHACKAELVLVAARSDVHATHVSVLRRDAGEIVSHAPEF